MQLAEEKFRAVSAELERLKAKEGNALTGGQKRIEELTKENRGLREEVGNWHKQNANLKSQLDAALREGKENLEARAAADDAAKTMKEEIEGLKTAAKEAAGVHNELEMTKWNIKFNVWLNWRTCASLLQQMEKLKLQNETQGRSTAATSARTCLSSQLWQPRRG